jgi:hypothetical protein
MGDGLRFRRDNRQTTEVAIAVTVMNHMLKLGRARYVPSHERSEGRDRSIHFPDPCNTMHVATNACRRRRAMFHEIRRGDITALVSGSSAAI